MKKGTMFFLALGAMFLAYGGVGTPPTVTDGKVTAALDTSQLQTGATIDTALYKIDMAGTKTKLDAQVAAIEAARIYKVVDTTTETTTGTATLAKSDTTTAEESAGDHLILSKAGTTARVMVASQTKKAGGTTQQ